MVVHAVSVAANGGGACSGPGAGQAGVAHHAVGGDTVQAQGREHHGVGAGGFYHHLHLARAACEAVAAHGGGVAAAQAEDVVGRQGQCGGALQFENFHLLNGLHGLGAAQGRQVERGACVQHQGVCARSAIDVAAACGQGGLQVDTGCHSDHIAAAHGVDRATAETEGGGDGAIGTVCVARIAARHQRIGRIGRRGLRERDVVQREIAGTDPAVSSQFNRDGPG